MELNELMDELRRRAEYYDHGHGPLHAAALQAIEWLLTPQVPAAPPPEEPPPVRSEPSERRAPSAPHPDDQSRRHPKRNSAAAHR